MFFERLHCIRSVGKNAAGDNQALLSGVVIVASMMLISGKKYEYLQSPNGDNCKIRRKMEEEPPRFQLEVRKWNPRTRRLELTLGMDFTLDPPLTGAELESAFAELDQGLLHDKKSRQELI